MLLELFPRWPFVRQHVCHGSAPRAVGHSTHGTPDHVHRSWVMTEHGKGWIHHHDTRGYTVEFPDGRLLLCKIVHNVSKDGE